MAKTQIKSDKEVSVLVDNQSYTEHSTTIKYKDRRFKLVSYHRNGNQEVVIYLFTEGNGWVFLYNQNEIKNVECISYVANQDKQASLAIQNYYAMVDHLKKVFA